jgi:thiol-disulfide isomerase/thioredoxin
MMKKSLLFFVIAAVIISCAETRVHTEKYKTHDILVGEGNLKDIQKDPYKNWFMENSSNYSPDSTIIQQIKPQVNHYDYLIIMGTWCPDSQLQVPIFYKILKESGYKNPDDIKVIYVPRKYHNYKMIKNKNIKRVPTIIVLKNHQEKGRIIEYPMQSIEKDLEQIYNGNYTHELEN